MTDEKQDRPRILQAGTIALIVGLVGLGLTGVGLVLNGTGHYPHADTGQFFRSYLFAWLFWFGVSMGAMAVLMLYHCTGGGWGMLISRLAEHAAAVLPLMMLLFIPLCLGLKFLYPWADPARLAHDPVLQLRHPYLNGPWFIIRSYIYLAIFSAMAYCLRSWSLARDTTGSPVYAHRLSRLSAGGMALYFFVMTIAAIDWIMSREAHWYSSVYGFIIVVGQSLSGLCFLLVMLDLLRTSPPFDTIIRPTLLNDDGNLLLTLVILWAYMALSQLLVIWMSNLQGDITWYIHRTQRGWQYVCVILILLHFFIPFAMLLKQSNKRDIRILGGLAGGLLALHVLDMMWMVLPSSATPTPHGASWMDLTAFAGIGGVWFAAFLWLTDDHPLIPVGRAVPILPEQHGRQPRSSSIG